MKTIRVTLSKPGAQCACLLSYRLTEAPDSADWSGNREAFSLSRPDFPDFGFPLERLQSVVAHQAALAGATFTITDLGGEATTWTDEVISPGQSGQ